MTPGKTTPGIDSSIQKCVDELHEYLQHPDLEVETKKIMQKLREAKYNPGSLKPLADCMLAILLAARSQGYSTDDLFNELMKVAKEISGKKWKKMPDGTYRVIR